jgi:H+/Cl- antiporter ClcA
LAATGHLSDRSDLIGLAAVGFAKLADASHDIFSRILKETPWLPLIISPLGFAALAHVTAHWFPAAAGSGIPQVIAARRSKNATFRRRLLGWPTMIAKIAKTAIAHITR